MMSLEILNRFEEQERFLKKLYAIFKSEDSRQWWLTLTIHFNVDAEKSRQRCIENEIYASKMPPTGIIKAIIGLFNLAVDFPKVPFIDNTVTRICLRTNTELDPHVSNTLSVSICVNCA